jgi:bifunctional non-homologous end joining protein LigD
VPELVSWEWTTSKRRGLTRLDYTQNAINKTLVAPFSARPAAGAPVSVPITWEELDDPDLRPDRWTIRTIAARVADAGDPLAPLVGLEQRLPDL